MSADDEGNLPGTILGDINYLSLFFSSAHLAASEGHVECLQLLVYHNGSPLAVIRSKNNKVTERTDLDLDKLWMRFLLLQGLMPKQLAIQYQKQDCADFLSSAGVCITCMCVSLSLSVCVCVCCTNQYQLLSFLQRQNLKQRI